MAASNINRVTITGNLTRDPELRSIGSSGISVCEMRVACNGSRKNRETGQWEDKPNYFDVKVWGAQGENCSRYLSKGRPVAVDGRLDWSEWADKDTGKNRQKVEIIADTVQFLGGGRDDNGGSSSAPAASGFTPTSSDVPSDTSDFASAPVGGGATADDDIPF